MRVQHTRHMPWREGACLSSVALTAECRRAVTLLCHCTLAQMAQLLHCCCTVALLHCCTVAPSTAAALLDRGTVWLGTHHRARTHGHTCTVARWDLWHGPVQNLAMHGCFVSPTRLGPRCCCPMHACTHRTLVRMHVSTGACMHSYRSSKQRS